MPKTIKNAFEKSLTFDKILAAHYRAKKNKTFKYEIINFELNLENNLINLLNNIKNNTYKVGKYRSFTIYEPKERIIQALPYQDRIVHQWYVEEFIKPYIVPKFIYSSFACLTDKGTHKAVDYIQKQMRIFQRACPDYWILKCDIKKFFYNIDKNILFSIMKKYISDKKLLNFTKLLIFSCSKPYSDIGIPIGNYTSQFFANIYLNELDQFIKRTLHLKYYVRYMDDFIILLQNKSDCKKYKQIIEKFLAQRLRLNLNDKSRYYPSKMGVNFCGYRIFSTHRLLRTSSKKKIKRKIKTWNNLYQNGNLDFQKVVPRLNSWLGHSSHCNSYNLQQKILNKCNFLVNKNYYQKEYEKFFESIKNFKIDSLL